MLFKSFKKSRNFKESFNYALEGIKTGVSNERNLKIDIFMAILVVILGIIFKISTIEWIILVVLIGLVISLELVNTAIEEVVNLLSPDKQIHAKKAKDIAAGAVLVIATSSLIAGLIIFLPKIIEVLR